MDAHTNFAVSTVATAPSPATSGTSLVVASGDGSLFPAVPFNATVWPASSQPTAANAEIVRVTARSTDTLTITRAQESTSARSIGAGDQIAASITAKTLTDVETRVANTVVEVGHAENAANVLPTSTTELSLGVDISFTADGTSAYEYELYFIGEITTSQDFMNVKLRENPAGANTDCGNVAQFSAPTSSQLVTVATKFRRTPSAGSVTWRGTIQRAGGTGTTSGAYGSSGSGFPPIRATVRKISA